VRYLLLTNPKNKAFRMDTYSASPEGTIMIERTTKHDKEPFVALLRDLGGVPLVYLEDDLQFTEYFESKLLQEIEKDPDVFTSFFCSRKEPTETKMLSPSTFVLNLCLYMPVWFQQGIMDFYDTASDEITGLHADTLIKAYLQSKKQKYKMVIPSLVQHVGSPWTAPSFKEV